jgi:7-keto-8-aminopelargonate synthetase-like enzyme/predicted N-acyltransferase
MAKTKHNNFLDTVDQIFTDAKNKGVFHLYTEDEEYTGRHLQIKGKKMYHFGTTGYLGLEQDERLKRAAIEAILKFGTQFPLSKTFVSFVLYKELEESLHKMYGSSVLVAKNSTLCHQAVIPGIVRDEDAIILDHQVHNSVQTACNMLKPRGVKIDMIRHSNLNMLEDRIKFLRDRYNKVWYMIDGVYSMFGDCAPLPELLELLDRYPSFHLYADDVHGMSWAGEHGTGYVMSKVKTLHEKMVLVATLSKSFGASGGIMVCQNKELSRYVKNFGGPLSFSAQLEPASVAAAVASAKIHLSDEIYSMQQELADKIEYCNSLLREAQIPLMAENQCPVFYIPTGLPSSGYNMSNRLMDEGFYINMGIFPAVPVKNTGIRFTISRHNQKEEIKALVEAVKYHYPRMLEEENRTENSVRKAFDLPLLLEEVTQELLQNDFEIIHKTSIDDIDNKQWDTLFGDKGIFDSEGVRFLERSFSGNKKIEHNWDFHYLIIKDKKDKVIAATFLTIALLKEDMMAQASVSMQIEEERRKDPYYLTSKAVMLGSLVSEGEHLYVDKKDPNWKKAMKILIDLITEEQDKNNASLIMLRDFEDSDNELKELLTEQGFLRTTLPESCIVEKMEWNTIEEYVESLSARSRKHLRTDVLKYEQFYNVEIKETVSDEEIKKYMSLFDNVKSRNFDINTFNYPEKFFKNISDYKNWEFIILKLNPNLCDDAPTDPIAVIFSYKSSGDNYNAVFLGMDYDYVYKYNVYKQVIFQIIKRAKALNARKASLGFSASLEKRKFGARAIPKIAYVQAKDNFNMEFIETITGATTTKTNETTSKVGEDESKAA